MALQLTACIWFGLMLSPKSPLATSDIHGTLGEMTLRSNPSGSHFAGYPLLCNGSGMRMSERLQQM